MRRLACFALVPLLVAACSGKTLPGAGLMVTMRTDLKVPANVDVVGVYIARLGQAGTVEVISSTEVQAEYTSDDGAKHVVLPGTLAIESDHDPETRIRVRVVAYDVARKPVAMREARLFVPTEDLRALPMPLLWMNTDDVADSAPDGSEPDPILGDAKVVTPTRAGVDAFARFKSDFCGDDMTLDDTGACHTIQVETDQLLQYVDPASDLARGIIDAEVATGTSGGAPDNDGEGGGTRSHAFCAQDQARPCFDAIGCFPSGETDPNFITLEVTPDQISGDGKACTVSLASIAANVPGGMSVTDVALAVKTSVAEGATCTETGGCVIPLDIAAGTKLDVASQTVALPPGVCRKAKKTGSTVVSIVVSPICKPKLVDEPICRTADGAAATGTTVCHDGSGWNGLKDPDPVQPDAGTDGSTPEEFCADYPLATGFWAEPTRISVIDSAGLFTVLRDLDLGGTCVTRSGGTTANVSGTPAGQYRLYGQSFDTETYVSFSAKESVGGGVLRYDAEGTPNPSLVVGSAELRGGAFLEMFSESAMTTAPTALLSSKEGRVYLSRGTSSPPNVPASPWDNSTNLVTLPAQSGAPEQNVLAVTTVASSLSLLSCAVTTSSGSVACEAATLLGAPTGDPQPIALAADGNAVYALLARDLETSVITIDPFGATVKRIATLPQSNGGVPSTMSLALTRVGPLRGYFASDQALYRVDLGDSPSIVPVPLARSGSFKAIQILDQTLFTLETNLQGKTQLRIRRLDSDGLVVDE